MNWRLAAFVFTSLLLGACRMDRQHLVSSCEKDAVGENLNKVYSSLEAKESIIHCMSRAGYNYRGDNDECGQRFGVSARMMVPDCYRSKNWMQRIGDYLEPQPLNLP